jgi:methionine aminopeptidase
MTIQKFGDSFEIRKLLRARDLARNITYELSSLIKPGMVEEEAHLLYKELCQRHQIERQWHPPKIRFGKNTLKNFRDPSDEYVLQNDDLFFIDIGPLIEGHEADFGETFVLGSNYEHKKIAQASQAIFNEVSDFWKGHKTSGAPLYEFASQKAKERGYELNMNSDGHRISDFPHHLFFKGGLAECEEKVIANAWILEIHLSDSKQQIGAFFEDILTDEL